MNFAWRLLANRKFNHFCFCQVCIGGDYLELAESLRVSVGVVLLELFPLSVAPVRNISNKRYRLLPKNMKIITFDKIESVLS